VKSREAFRLQVRANEEIAGKIRAHHAAARVDRLDAQTRIEGFQSTGQELAVEELFLLRLAANYIPKFNEVCPVSIPDII
jgi:hypothetical protein